MMLQRYVGPYVQLTIQQKDAVTQLLIARYLEDVLQLDDYLESELGLRPGTKQYATEYEARYQVVVKSLAHFEERDQIVALFATDQASNEIAVATMKTVRGTRPDVSIADSIGDPTSSIPTHCLLKSFDYPCLPGFDPYEISEVDMLECARLAVCNKAQLGHLVETGVLNSDMADYLRAYALDELLVASHRRSTAPGEPWFAAVIFTVKPTLAKALNRVKGLNLLPLYSHGTEPAEETLDPTAPFATHFYRLQRALLQQVPGVPYRERMTEASHERPLREPKSLRRGEVSVPFLLLHDEPMTRAFRRLEETLEQVRSTVGATVAAA